jgi:uncharacterized repeat protein (TIGR02543 family)
LRRGAAGLVAAAIALPLVAPASNADPTDTPPAELVVTAQDLDPSAAKLQAVVSSTAQGDYAFKLEGTNAAFDAKYPDDYLLEGTGLTLEGTFAVPIEVTGASPDESPLRVKLNAVTSNGAPGGPAFALANGANVALALEGSNNLVSTQGAGLQVIAGTKLSIADASGAGEPVPTLQVQGADRAAGIGGGDQDGTQGTGTISIGGEVQVEAVGSTDGAGIGGGRSGYAGVIEIKGSSRINATSIGAGIVGSGGLITISGLAEVDVTSTSSSATGIGGGTSGTVTISDSARVRVTSSSTYYGSAGIGGGGGWHGTVTISDSALVDVSALGEAAAIGSGGISQSPGGVVTISGNATVTATAERGAAIGGGYGSPGGVIRITDTAKVIATTTKGTTFGPAAIGGSGAGGMGQVTISGDAMVRASATGTGNTVGIGGSGTRGASPDHFVRIEGSPTVVAYGSVAGIGGGSGTAAVQGSVTISGGFVVASASAAENYAVGSVAGTVSITGGSAYPAVGARGVSGVQDPVGADGEPVFPLHLPAHNGGADLTNLDLTSPPFAYAQHTITEAQRAFIASNAPDTFPAPASVPATSADADRLAATLWVPVGQLSGIELRDVEGFAANVKSGTIPPYSATLGQNVLRDQVVNVQVTASGTPYESTSTALTLMFDQPVPGFEASQIAVTNGSASVATDPSGWSSSPDFKTWTMPLTSVSAQDEVVVDVLSLPGALAGHVVLGAPVEVTVNREAEVVLAPGRNWRPLADTAVVGFGSDVAVVDDANPAPTYWYIAQDLDAAAPSDGPAVRAAALASAEGRGGRGIVRAGQVGTATANSIRVTGLPDASAQVVYVAAEYVDPDQPTVTHFSKPIAIPADAYAAPANLVAANADIGAALSLDAVDAITWAIGGASGEFEAINGLALSVAGDQLELNGLTGARRVTADGGGHGTESIRVTLNGSTITGPANAEAVALTGGADVALDVVGTNAIIGSGNDVAVVRVPYDVDAQTASRLTIASSSAGALEVTKASGQNGSGIGGNWNEGAGTIMIGGDVRLTVASPDWKTESANAMIGSSGGRAGSITIQDEAWVKTGAVHDPNLYGAVAIGARGAGGAGGESTVAITDHATVGTVRNSFVGGTGVSVRVEGGFVVVGGEVTGADVRITGGSVWVDPASEMDAPKDGDGNAVYPLYVPAVLAYRISPRVWASLTNLDVGGSNLPYTQHTITEEQKDWLAGLGTFPAPTTFPATSADAGNLAAVLWVAAPASPGLVGDIQLGQAPDFDGAATGAAKVVAGAPAWSTALANNLVATQVEATLTANGAKGTQTSTELVMRLQPESPGLRPDDLVVVPGTGSAVVTRMSPESTGLGSLYVMDLAAEPTEGDLRIGFASHNFVAPLVNGEVYRNQGAALTVTDPGTRHFTSIGGNFAVTANWPGEYYAQVGGTAPGSIDELKASAQLTGDLVYGANTIDQGAVTYGYAADEEIPVYWAFQAENGNWSGIVQSAIPAYTGDPAWFALPAGTASAAVTATAQSADVYRLTGLSGALTWLNGHDLRFDSVPLELNSSFSGTRTFRVDGSSIGNLAPLRVRINGLTLSGVARPFVLANGAQGSLTVDGSNSLASSSGGSPCGLTVEPGTSLAITSSSGGDLTAQGGSYSSTRAYGPGIGAQNGSGALRIDGDVTVRAIGAGSSDYGAAGIGADVRNGSSMYAMGGPVVIGGQARVYATGSGSGAGIGGTGSGGVGATGATNSITIQDDAFVVAVGGATGVGIGGGNSTVAGLGTVTITGGTVVARPGATTNPAIGGLAPGAVKITGGNVYAGNTSLGAGDLVGADSAAVYPLYVPASLGATDLKDTQVTSADWPGGSLQTIRPDAEAQLAAWGIADHWPADLAGVAWVAADQAKGKLYRSFEADGVPVVGTAQSASGEARAFVSPQFRSLGSAQSSDYNILTEGLDLLTISGDGAVDTATTRVLTFTLEDAADLAGSTVTLAPEGTFAATAGVLTAVEGSGNTKYSVDVTGDWSEGDVVRVTLDSSSSAAHVAPPIQDVTLHRDVTPPVLSDPAGERLTGTTASATVTASEAGQLFYLALPATASGPSDADVKAGTKLAMTAGVNTIAITGLASNAEQKVYLLAQDLEGLWSSPVTEIGLPEAYPFSVGLAPSHGSITNAADLATAYPAGARIELKARPEMAYAVESWSDGGAGGSFTDRHASTTVYTMPSGPAQVDVSFGRAVAYVSAEAIDGAAGTATTTQVRLTFEFSLPDGLNASNIVLPSGMAVTGVASAGDGVYVVTLSGVSAEGTAPFEVRSPGTAFVPVVHDAVLHYDSTAPALTEAGWSRTAVSSGSVSFEASESGTYYFLVDLVGSTAPSAADVVAGARSDAMDAGSNTISLDGSDLTTGARRVVYVVGVDGEGNRSSVAVLPLGAFSKLTVHRRVIDPGTAYADADSYAEGAQAYLTAIPAKGYEFIRWQPEAGASEAMFGDTGSASTSFTMPGNDATVRALFAKRTLSVGFVLDVPPAAPEDTSDWSASGEAVIEGRIPAPPATPELADYRFVGWYTEPQVLDRADPSKAWYFAKAPVTADMIADDGVTVTLYGAWATKYGEVRYALGGSETEPVSPTSVGPDRVEIGSKIVDAPSFGTVLSRAGYTFDGWFVDAGHQQPVAAETTLDELSLTLHAKWLPNGDADYFVKHYKTAFSPVGVLADTEILEGRIGTSVTAVPRQYVGYLYDQASSTTSGTVTEDPALVLDLYYEAKLVAVVFDTGDGSPQPATVAGRYDHPLRIRPNEVNRPGYALLGWRSATVDRWDFATTPMTVDNGVTGIDGSVGRLELTAVWAAAPTATGATYTIGLAGETVLAGSATADTANGASIRKAVVTTEAEWLAKATIEPALDGTVRFQAGSLPAGDYPFVVEYTDSNDLTATADFTVTVAAPPSVSGETADRIKAGGTADFTMTVKSAATVTGTVVTGEATVTAGVTANKNGKVGFGAGSLPGGVYHFWVAWRDDLGQSSAVKEFTVAVQAAPAGSGYNIDLADDRETGAVDPLKDVTGDYLQPLTNSSFTQPAHGKLALDGQSLKYTPDRGWEGTDPFEVTVCDDLDQCVVLRYSFTVLSVWVAPVAPVVSGDTAVIGVGQTADLKGTVDPVHSPAIVNAFVTPFLAWMADATITPSTDGKVTFQAGTLAAGVYEFTVRYTDSNGLWADAKFAVTVVDKPLVTGETSARVKVGGTASFALTVESDVTIASAVPSGVPAGATVTAGTDGAVTFQAGSLQPGDHTFTVTYQDSTGQASEPVEFTVTVQAPPTGQGRDVTVPDDLTSVRLEPLADAAGVGLQPLTAASSTVPDHGTLKPEGAGLRYVPEVGWSGTAAFTVTVCDDLDQCVDLDYTVKVLNVWSPPEPPTATGDTATIGTGGTAELEGEVRADAGHGASIVKAQVVSTDAWLADATIVARTDGGVSFDAGTLAAGVYPFTVRYTDSNSLTADAVYTVTVVAPPAVGGGLAAKAPLGGTARFQLTVASGVEVVSGSASGLPDGASATVDAAGSVSFSAGSLAPGEYQFDVAFTDSLGQASVPVTLNVTVQGPPGGSGREFDVADDLTGVDVDVAADVTGTALQALTAVSVSGPTHGKVTVTGPGAVRYTPMPGWRGADSFVVTVCDDLGQCVALGYTANVLESVAEPAGPPAASGASGTVGMGGTVELLGAAHADTEHGASIVSAVVTASGEWASGAGIAPKLDGTVWFDARALPAGEYAFTVTFTDSNGATAAAEYTVTVVEFALVSGGTSAKTGIGGRIDLPLTVAPGAAIEVAAAEGVPAGATASVGLDGLIGFEAGSLPEGVYRFTVRFEDPADGATQEVVVSVTVQGPPRAAAEVVRAKVRAGGQLMFPEDVTSTYGWIAERRIEDAPDQGTAVLGSVHYDSTGAAVGEHQFVVDYTDDLGQSTTVTYIPLVQAPPTGEGRSFDVADDRTAIDIDVLADVTGADLRPLVAGSIAQPDHGVVALEGTGVRYVPEVGWKGTTSFKVTVCDDLAQCVDLTYEVTVLAVKPTPSPTPTPTPSQTPGPEPTASPTATAPGDEASASGGAGSGQADGDLPFTGSGPLLALALAALGLLAAGWLLRLAARRH